MYTQHLLVDLAARPFWYASFYVPEKFQWAVGMQSLLQQGMLRPQVDCVGWVSSGGMGLLQPAQSVRSICSQIYTEEIYNYGLQKIYTEGMYNYILDMQHCNKNTFVVIEISSW